MKQLYQYIKESILDDEDDIIDSAVLTPELVSEEFAKVNITVPADWIKINKQRVDIYPKHSGYRTPTLDINNPRIKGEYDLKPVGLPESIVLGTVYGIVSYNDSYRNIDPSFLPKRCGGMWIRSKTDCDFGGKEVTIDSNLVKGWESGRLIFDHTKYGKKRVNPFTVNFEGQTRAVKFFPGLLNINDLGLYIKLNNCEEIDATIDLGKKEKDPKDIELIEKRLNKMAKNLGVKYIGDHKYTHFIWDEKENKYKFHPTE